MYTSAQLENNSTSSSSDEPEGGEGYTESWLTATGVAVQELKSDKDRAERSGIRLPGGSGYEERLAFDSRGQGYKKLTLTYPYFTE